MFLLSILISKCLKAIYYIRFWIESYVHTSNIVPNFVAEPKSGFRIAFNMFDTDGNERVDKTEFLVVKTTFFSLNRSYLHASSILEISRIEYF